MTSTTIIASYSVEGLSSFQTGGDFFCGTVASLVFFIALSKGEVANVVSVTSIYPLITIVLSSLFLKEAITLPQMLGVLLAIIAVILSAY